MRGIRRSGFPITVCALISELQVGGTWYEVRTFLTLAHYLDETYV